MRRLDFRIPDFVRRAWVSTAARVSWEPRIERIQAAWRSIERESVAHHLRECAIVTVAPADLVKLAGGLASREIFILPIDRTLTTPGVYQSAILPAKEGESFDYRLAIGSADALGRFKQAWDEEDDEVLGGLLGYPTCCRAFFRYIWGELGMRDPTWVMAGGGVAVSDTRRTIELVPSPEANVLARFIGVRCVPHLPCRFTCPPSIDLGRKLLALGQELRFTEEMGWLEEILSWPFEWSALHGVAEIRTPVLKVAVATDATADTHVVRLKGTVRPLEAAASSRFPYAVDAGFNPACRDQSVCPEEPHSGVSS